MDLKWLEGMGLRSHHLPSCAGEYKGKLIIVGSGDSARSDLRKLGLKWGQPKPESGVHVMAVNDAIMHYGGPLTHCYSNDFKMLPKWAEARRPDMKEMDPRPPKVHSLHDKPGIIGWPWPGHGTSGLNAVYTGLGLGYDDIVLCGIPMDGSEHYFDFLERPTNYHTTVDKFFGKAARGMFRGKVKSMSGRTMEICGAP